MEMIKINRFAITEDAFNYKMDKAPDFLMIKMHEDKLVCDALGVYISAEDANKIGLQNLAELIHNYNEIFRQELFV